MIQTIGRNIRVGRKVSDGSLLYNFGMVAPTNFLFDGLTRDPSLHDVHSYSARKVKRGQSNRLLDKDGHRKLKLGGLVQDAPFDEPH
jgi:hypothetical protein